MFNIAISFFVGFELCYYLLIAQTGIVEVFNSNLLYIGLLPIGGMLGSYGSASLHLQENIKVYFLLLLQTVMTLFYPNLNIFMLFILGIAVGGMAPLIVNSLKRANKIELIIALSLAYTIGTLLFNYNPYNRKFLGVVFSLIVLFSYIIIDKKILFKQKRFSNIYDTHPIALMTLWAFLDSALFETLSRDTSSISIWREDYTTLIILFHIIGVLAGAFIKFSKLQKQILIMVLFALSYLFYIIKEPYLLSVVYPFVISFYNVAILESLIMQKELRKIGIFMIFIGWIASGVGLFIALTHLTFYIPVVILIVSLAIIARVRIETKPIIGGAL